MEGSGQDDGLTTGSATGGPSSRAAWAELARAAQHDGDPEPETLAQLINMSASSLQFGILLFNAIKSGILESAPRTTEHERTSRLVVGLRPDVLATALTSQMDTGSLKRVLRAAVDGLSPETLYALTRAASSASGQPMSNVLETLLKKLEMQAARPGNGPRSHADSAFRSLVHHLIDHWPGPVETSGNDVAPEPERVLKLVLEIGAVGNMLQEAVAGLSDDRDLRGLLSMVKDAPEESRAAELIARQFAQPTLLGQLLREDPVDFETVDALVRHLQLGAADTLLQELVNSASRVTRRGILDRLARLGPDIAPMVILRLKDERWFVLRNMLHVLNEAGCSVARVPLASYQAHTDARVRREAMQLLFKDAVTRDRALAVAFRDTDPVILRSALKEARRRLPDAVVPILAKRTADAAFPPEFRLPAIQLLNRSTSLLALDALLPFVAAGTTLAGKPRLADNSPEMLAALRGLARSWPHEPRAAALLEAARGSLDTELRAAAESGPGTKDNAGDE